MDDGLNEQNETPRRAEVSSASTWVLMGLLAMVILGFLAYQSFKPSGPVPVDIAGDPFLLEGRALYQERCVSCHGVSGEGDGPIAATLTGPPPGNLTDGDWKHGDRPEDVLRVLNRGVVGTSMPGWKGIFRDDQLPAVAAYVYYIAGREIPDVLRPTDLDDEGDPNAALEPIADQAE